MTEYIDWHVNIVESAAMNISPINDTDKGYHKKEHRNIGTLINILQFSSFFFFALLLHQFIIRAQDPWQIELYCSQETLSRDHDGRVHVSNQSQNMSKPPDARRYPAQTAVPTKGLPLSQALRSSPASLPLASVFIHLHFTPLLTNSKPKPITHTMNFLKYYL